MTGQVERSVGKTDATQFIDNVLASGLLSRGDLDRALSDAPETDRGKVLARHLVQKKKLTRWQAERLLSGQISGFLLGQYAILEELGRGGMGRVYKAEHRAMGRVVALKILSPEVANSEKARQCFEREVQAAARLNHPNIVSAYDANHALGRTFLVMEYIDGPSLSYLVNERGPLPIADVVTIARQIASALDYAHRQGIIHRDIKPSNLLLRRSEDSLQVKLLDFGLVMILEDGQPSSMRDSGNSIMMGTPDFVSPEQARAPKTVDSRTDLYSLGCTLYYLLTGQVPYPGGTSLEKILKHSADPVPNVLASRNDAPDYLVNLVARLMAKKPADRYQSAADVIAELNEVQPDTIVDSTPPDAATPNGVRVAKPRPTTDPWANLHDDPSEATLTTQAASTGEIALRARGQNHSSQTMGKAIIVAVVAASAVVAVGLTFRYLLSLIN